MQLGAQNKLILGTILGPKRASWGPNKHQPTCINFAKPEQTNPLESLPIEGYDRPNDFLQGLTNGRGERIRTTCLTKRIQRVSNSVKFQGATWGPFEPQLITIDIPESEKVSV